LARHPVPDRDLADRRPIQHLQHGPVPLLRALVTRSRSVSGGLVSWRQCGLLFLEARRHLEHLAKIIAELTGT
jgi:hypothetical protein